MVTWLAGVVVLAVYRAGGWLYVQHLRRHGRPERDARRHGQLDRLRDVMRVKRLVRVLHCPRIDSPAVVGVLKPAILLPLGCLLNLTPQQLAAILAHELAHVRRHDYLMNLIQTAVETLLFFHPAMWWISRRICAEREHACDDLAVSALGGDRVSYAGALARLEELRAATPPAPALAARGGPLLARVRRVLDRSAAPQRASWWPAAALGAVACALVLATATAHVSAEHQAKPESRTATVVCVDETGQPAQGADVYLIDSFSGTGKLQTTAPDPVKTGPDGVASFGQLPTAPEMSGQITAYARVPGRLAGLAFQSPQMLGGRPLDEPMRLEMRPAVALRGRITAPAGTPLDQPEVRLLALNNLQAHEGRARSGGHLFRESFLAAQRLVRDVFTYRVAADGAVTLTDIPDNASVILAAHAAGLSRELVSARHRAGQAMDFEVELRPQAVIEGRIEVAGEAPLETITVEARLHPRPSRVGYIVPHETKPDRDGRFRLENLPEGVYSIQLVAVPDGFVAPIDAARVGYDEVKTGVTIPLGRGQLLRGTVTDVETGKPLAGAVIGVSSVVEMESERVSHSAPTGDDGTFDVRVPPGKAGVHVMQYPRGYSRDDENPHHTQVEIETNGRDVLDQLAFKLKSGLRQPKSFGPNSRTWVTITGRVVDADGKPIPGVPVLIRLTEPQPNGLRTPGTYSVPKTKDDGSYEIGAELIEVEQVVALEEGPAAAARSKPFVPRRDGGPTRVEDIVTRRLPVVSEVSGVLVDPRGRPVAGASVRLTDARSVQSDAAGRFRFDLYDAEKPVSLDVQANSFQRQSWYFIPPGTRDARFVLRPINPKLPEWSESPALPDPAKLIGRPAPELNITWVTRPDDNAQPPATKRADGRSTALLFVGHCATAEEYRAQVESFAEACARKPVETVVIFGPRFHESAVRAIVASTGVKIWSGIDPWMEADTPVTFSGATMSTYGRTNRRTPMAFVIDLDGVVRHASDSFAALRDFLEKQ